MEKRDVGKTLRQEFRVKPRSELMKGGACPRVHSVQTCVSVLIYVRALSCHLSPVWVVFFISLSLSLSTQSFSSTVAFSPL